MKHLLAYPVVLICIALIFLVVISKWKLLKKYHALQASFRESKSHEVSLISAQASLNTDIQDTKSKLSALRELSMGVAHDTNTAFAYILDLISIYQGKNELSSELHQLLENISRSCLHGRGVIQSLHYTSKESPVTVIKKPSTTTGLSILLVDDDELIRLSFTPMLGILGHTVTTASGGLEAVQMFERGLTVDVVILDMNMPGFDGSQTLTRILMINPDQKVLMASGMSSEEVIAKLIVGLPNVGRLHKPFSLGEIREKLDLRSKN